MVDVGLKSAWWEPSKGVEILQFLGHPFIALLLATLAASYFLGTRRGYSSKRLLEMANRALGPAGLIILVTGAGGVFKQVLVDSGAGAALAETVSDMHIAPIVLAYLLAAIIRLTQGSATVAMITAAGMMAPVLEVFELSDPHKGLIVLAIAAGATIFSHVNDSGFWLIGKYLNMTEKQTLQSWSVMETIISVVGFVLVLILSWFV
jgi:Gnt-I system low-affinity gluconate transporter